MRDRIVGVLESYLLLAIFMQPFVHVGCLLRLAFIVIAWFCAALSSGRHLRGFRALIFTNA